MKPAPLLTKIICSCLATILFAQVAFAHKPEVNFWTERSLSLRGSPQGDRSNLPYPSSKDGLLRSARNDRPLTQFGSIRGISKSQSSNLQTSQTVVHIQDVHSNPEAQKNIAGAIQTLIQDGRADLIALEGAFGPVNLQPFKEFPDQNAIRAAADELLAGNEITGPIHGLLSLSENQSLPMIIGVDDAKHYWANVQAVKDSYPQKERLKAALSQQKQALTLKKEKVFNPRLLQFDRSVEKFREGKLEVGDYALLLSAQSNEFSPVVESFVEAVHLERKMDEMRIERERAVLVSELTQRLNENETNQLTAKAAAFHAGLINHADFYGSLKQLCETKGLSFAQFPAMAEYLQYLLLSASIDGDKLNSDINALEKEVYAGLAQTNEERKLLREAHQLYLQSKLVDFALTKAEWKEYRSNSQLRAFENFYREAEIRDRLMAENLAKAMEKYNAKNAVLITGGFHAEGIRRGLSGSYLSFVPKITHLETNSGIEHLSIFTQEKTPLEKLFEGEKLFLTQQPMSPTVYIKEGVLAVAKSNVEAAISQSWLEKTYGWTRVVVKKMRHAVVAIKGYIGDRFFELQIKGRVISLEDSFSSTVQQWLGKFFPRVAFEGNGPASRFSFMTAQGKKDGGPSEEEKMAAEISAKLGIKPPLRKILVVEDDHDVMNRILIAIEHGAGRYRDELEIDLATTGLEGYKRLPKKYDLVITDIDMPEMQGDQMVAQARGRGLVYPTLIHSSIASSKKTEHLPSVVHIQKRAHYDGYRVIELLVRQGVDIPHAVDSDSTVTVPEIKQFVEEQVWTDQAVINADRAANPSRVTVTYEKPTTPRQNLAAAMERLRAFLEKKTSRRYQIHWPVDSGTGGITFRFETLVILFIVAALIYPMGAPLVLAGLILPETNSVSSVQPNDSLSWWTRLKLAFGSFMAITGVYQLTNYYNAFASRQTYTSELGIDALIPFNPAFTIPYLFIFVMPLLQASVFKTARQWKAFLQANLLIIVPLIIFFLLVPTIVVRPDLANLAQPLFLLDVIHKVDLPYGAFPSLHATMGVMTLAVITQLDRRAAKKFVLPLIAMVLSTVLTKQHYVLDLATGTAIGLLGAHIFKGLYKGKSFSLRNWKFFPDAFSVGFVTVLVADWLTKLHVSQVLVEPSSGDPSPIFFLTGDVIETPQKVYSFWDNFFSGSWAMQLDPHFFTPFYWYCCLAFVVFTAVFLAMRYGFKYKFAFLGPASIQGVLIGATFANGSEAVAFDKVTNWLAMGSMSPINMADFFAYVVGSWLVVYLLYHVVKRIARWKNVEIIRGGVAGTDSDQNEYFDVLDENGAPTGQTKLRDDVHIDGDWHRVAHIWLGDEKGRIFFQKRSLSRKTSPGVFQVGVSGHVGAGRSAFEDALKEASEEIGIALDPSRLILITQDTGIKHGRMAKEGPNNEFVSVFFYPLTAAEKKEIRKKYNLKEMDYLQGMHVKKWEADFKRHPDLYSNSINHMITAEPDVYKIIVAHAAAASQKKPVKSRNISNIKSLLIILGVAFMVGFVAGSVKIRHPLLVGLLVAGILGLLSMRRNGEFKRILSSMMVGAGLIGLFGYSSAISPRIMRRSVPMPIVSTIRGVDTMDVTGEDYLFTLNMDPGVSRAEMDFDLGKGKLLETQFWDDSISNGAHLQAEIVEPKSARMEIVRNNGERFAGSAAFETGYMQSPFEKLHVIIETEKPGATVKFHLRAQIVSGSVSQKLWTAVNALIGMFLGLFWALFTRKKKKEPKPKVKVFFSDAPAGKDTMDNVKKMLEEFNGRAELVSEIGVGKDEEELKKVLQQRTPDIVVVRSDTKAFKKAELMPLAKESGVKAIVRAGAGVDNINVEAAKNNDIEVLRTHGNANSVANVTLRFFLAGLEKLSGLSVEENLSDVASDENWQKIFDMPLEQFDAALKKSIKAGRGEMSDEDFQKMFHPVSPERARELFNWLEGKTVGLLGWGPIAQDVARKLEAIRTLTGIKFQIVATSRSLVDGEEMAMKSAGDLGVLAAKPSLVIETADILSLHLPLTEETKHFLNAENLKNSRAKLIFNTGRDDLLSPDVFAEEPAFDYYADLDHTPAISEILKRYPNRVHVLPHIGASTADAARGVEEKTIETLKNLLRSNFGLILALIFCGVFLPQTGLIVSLIFSLPLQLLLKKERETVPIDAELSAFLINYQGHPRGDDGSFLGQFERLNTQKAVRTKTEKAVEMTPINGAFIHIGSADYLPEEPWKLQKLTGPHLIIDLENLHVADWLARLAKANKNELYELLSADVLLNNVLRVPAELRGQAALVNSVNLIPGLFEYVVQRVIKNNANVDEKELRRHLDKTHMEILDKLAKPDGVVHVVTRVVSYSAQGDPAALRPLRDFIGTLKRFAQALLGEFHPSYWRDFYRYLRPVYVRSTAENSNLPVHWDLPARMILEQATNTEPKNPWASWMPVESDFWMSMDKDNNRQIYQTILLFRRDRYRTFLPGGTVDVAQRLLPLTALNHRKSIDVAKMMLGVLKAQPKESLLYWGWDGSVLPYIASAQGINVTVVLPKGARKPDFQGAIHWVDQGAVPRRKFDHLVVADLQNAFDPQRRLTFDSPLPQFLSRFGSAKLKSVYIGSRSEFKFAEIRELLNQISPDDDFTWANVHALFEKHFSAVLDGPSLGPDQHAIVLIPKKKSSSGLKLFRSKPLLSLLIGLTLLGLLEPKALSFLPFLLGSVLWKKGRKAYTTDEQIAAELKRRDEAGVDNNAKTLEYGPYRDPALYRAALNSQTIELPRVRPGKAYKYETVEDIHTARLKRSADKKLNTAYAIQRSDPGLYQAHLRLKVLFDPVIKSHLNPFYRLKQARVRKISTWLELIKKEHVTYWRFVPLPVVEKLIKELLTALKDKRRKAFDPAVKNSADLKKRHFRTRLTSINKSLTKFYDYYSRRENTNRRDEAIPTLLTKLGFLMPQSGLKKIRTVKELESLINKGRIFKRNVAIGSFQLPWEKVSDELVRALVEELAAHKMGASVDTLRGSGQLESTVLGLSGPDFRNIKLDQSLIIDGIPQSLGNLHSYYQSLETERGKMTRWMILERAGYIPKFPSLKKIRDPFVFGQMIKAGVFPLIKAGRKREKTVRINWQRIWTWNPKLIKNLVVRLAEEARVPITDIRFNDFRDVVIPELGMPLLSLYESFDQAMPKGQEVRTFILQELGITAATRKQSEAFTLEQLQEIKEAGGFRGKRNNAWTILAVEGRRALILRSLGLLNGLVDFDALTGVTRLAFQKQKVPEINKTLHGLVNPYRRWDGATRGFWIIDLLDKNGFLVSPKNLSNALLAMAKGINLSQPLLDRISVGRRGELNAHRVLIDIALLRAVREPAWDDWIGFLKAYWALLDTIQYLPPDVFQIALNDMLKNDGDRALFNVVLKWFDAKSFVRGYLQRAAGQGQSFDFPQLRKEAADFWIERSIRDAEFVLDAPFDFPAWQSAPAELREFLDAELKVEEQPKNIDILHALGFLVRPETLESTLLRFARGWNLFQERQHNNHFFRSRTRFVEAIFFDTKDAPTMRRKVLQEIGEVRMEWLLHSSEEIREWLDSLEAILSVIDSVHYLPSWKLMPDLAPSFRENSEFHQALLFESFPGDSWIGAFLKQGVIAEFAIRDGELSELLSEQNGMEKWRLVNMIAQIHPAALWEQYHAIKNKLPTGRRAALQALIKETEHSLQNEGFFRRGGTELIVLAALVVLVLLVVPLLFVQWDLEAIEPWRLGLEIGGSIVTILGLPPLVYGLLMYIKGIQQNLDNEALERENEKKALKLARQRLAAELRELHQDYSREYDDLLKMDFENPELYLEGGAPGKKTFDGELERKRQTYFKLKEALFERVYVAIHRKHMSPLRQRLWKQWKDSMKEALDEPGFRGAIEKDDFKMLNGEDDAFVVYFKDLINQVKTAGENDRGGQTELSVLAVLAGLPLIIGALIYLVGWQTLLLGLAVVPMIAAGWIFSQNVKDALYRELKWSLRKSMESEWGEDTLSPELAGKVKQLLRDIANSPADEKQVFLNEEQEQLIFEALDSNPPAIQRRLLIDALFLMNFRFLMMKAEASYEKLSDAYYIFEKAVEGFDRAMGVRFITYLGAGIKRGTYFPRRNEIWTERRVFAIRNVLVQNNSGVSPQPEMIADEFNRRAFVRFYDREPSERVLRNIREGTASSQRAYQWRFITTARVEKILSAAGTVHLQGTLWEDIRDETSLIEDDPQDIEFNLERVKAALDQLTPRQRRIINMRYGLTGDAPMGQTEIAEILQCGSANVSYHEMKALKRLKRIFGIKSKKTTERRSDMYVAKKQKHQGAIVLAVAAALLLMGLGGGFTYLLMGLLFAPLAMAYRPLGRRKTQFTKDEVMRTDLLAEHEQQYGTLHVDDLVSWINTLVKQHVQHGVAFGGIEVVNVYVHTLGKSPVQTDFYVANYFIVDAQKFKELMASTYRADERDTIRVYRHENSISVRIDRENDEPVPPVQKQAVYFTSLSKIETQEKMPHTHPTVQRDIDTIMKIWEPTKSLHLEIQDNGADVPYEFPREILETAHSARLLAHLSKSSLILNRAPRKNVEDNDSGNMARQVLIGLFQSLLNKPGLMKTVRFGAKRAALRTLPKAAQKKPSVVQKKKPELKKASKPKSPGDHNGHGEFLRARARDFAQDIIKRLEASQYKRLVFRFPGRSLQRKLDYDELAKLQKPLERLYLKIVKTNQEANKSFGFKIKPEAKRLIVEITDPGQSVKRAGPFGFVAAISLLFMLASSNWQMLVMALTFAPVAMALWPSWFPEKLKNEKHEGLVRLFVRNPHKIVEAWEWLKENKNDALQDALEDPRVAKAHQDFSKTQSRRGFMQTVAGAVQQASTPHQVSPESLKAVEKFMRKRWSDYIDFISEEGRAIFLQGVQSTAAILQEYSQMPADQLAKVKSIETVDDYVDMQSLILPHLVVGHEKMWGQSGNPKMKDYFLSPNVISYMQRQAVLDYAIVREAEHRVGEKRIKEIEAKAKRSYPFNVLKPDYETNATEHWLRRAVKSASHGTKQDLQSALKLLTSKFATRDYIGIWENHYNWLEWTELKEIVKPEFLVQEGVRRLRRAMLSRSTDKRINRVIERIESAAPDQQERLLDEAFKQDEIEREREYSDPGDDAVWEQNRNKFHQDPRTIAPYRGYRHALNKLFVVAIVALGILSIAPSLNWQLVGFALVLAPVAMALWPQWVPENTREPNELISFFVKNPRAIPVAHEWLKTNENAELRAAVENKYIVELHQMLTSRRGFMKQAAVAYLQASNLTTSPETIKAAARYFATRGWDPYLNFASSRAAQMFESSLYQAQMFLKGIAGTYGIVAPPEFFVKALGLKMGGVSPSEIDAVGRIRTLGDLFEAKRKMSVKGYRTAAHFVFRHTPYSAALSEEIEERLGSEAKAKLVAHFVHSKALEAFIPGESTRLILDMFNVWISDLAIKGKIRTEEDIRGLVRSLTKMDSRIIGVLFDRWTRWVDDHSWMALKTYVKPEFYFQFGRQRLVRKLKGQRFSDEKINEIITELGRIPQDQQQEVLDDALLHLDLMGLDQRIGTTQQDDSLFWQNRKQFWQDPRKIIPYRGYRHALSKLFVVAIVALGILSIAPSLNWQLVGFALVLAPVAMALDRRSFLKVSSGLLLALATPLAASPIFTHRKRTSTAFVDPDFLKPLDENKFHQKGRDRLAKALPISLAIIILAASTNWQMLTVALTFAPVAMALQIRSKFLDTQMRAAQDGAQGSGFNGLGTMDRDDHAPAQINLVAQDSMAARLTQKDKTGFLEGANNAGAGDLRQVRHQAAIFLMKIRRFSNDFLSSSMDHKYSLMAFLIFAVAWASVSPWDVQPGNSGAYTEYPPLGSFSIMILYSTLALLLFFIGGGVRLLKVFVSHSRDFLNFRRAGAYQKSWMRAIVMLGVGAALLGLVVAPQTMGMALVFAPVAMALWLQDKTILSFEDDASIGHALKRLFEIKGATFETFENPTQGVEYLAKYYRDLDFILLDVNLRSYVTGVDIFRLIKLVSAWHTIPVLFLTNEDPERLPVPGKLIVSKMSGISPLMERMEAVANEPADEFEINKLDIATDWLMHPAGHSARRHLTSLVRRDGEYLTSAHFDSLLRALEKEPRPIEVDIELAQILSEQAARLNQAHVARIISMLGTGKIASHTALGYLAQAVAGSPELDADNRSRTQQLIDGNKVEDNQARATLRGAIEENGSHAWLGDPPYLNLVKDMIGNLGLDGAVKRLKDIVSWQRSAKNSDSDNSLLQSALYFIHELGNTTRKNRSNVLRGVNEALELVVNPFPGIIKELIHAAGYTAVSSKLTDKFNKSVASRSTLLGFKPDEITTYIFERDRGPQAMGFVHARSKTLYFSLQTLTEAVDLAFNGWRPMYSIAGDLVNYGIDRVSVHEMLHILGFTEDHLMRLLLSPYETLPAPENRPTINKIIDDARKMAFEKGIDPARDHFRTNGFKKRRGSAMVEVTAAVVLMALMFGALVSLIDWQALLLLLTAAPVAFVSFYDEPANPPSLPVLLYLAMVRLGHKDLKNHSLQSFLPELKNKFRRDYFENRAGDYEKFEELLGSLYLSEDGKTIHSTEIDIHVGVGSIMGTEVTSELPSEIPKKSVPLKNDVDTEQAHTDRLNRYLGIVQKKHGVVNVPDLLEMFAGLPGFDRDSLIAKASNMEFVLHPTDEDVLIYQGANSRRGVSALEMMVILTIMTLGLGAVLSLIDWQALLILLTAAPVLGMAHVSNNPSPHEKNQKELARLLAKNPGILHGLPEPTQEILRRLSGKETLEQIARSLSHVSIYYEKKMLRIWIPALQFIAENGYPDVKAFVLQHYQGVYFRYQDKAILNSYFVEGKTIQEIANERQLSAVSVATNLHRIIGDIVSKIRADTEGGRLTLEVAATLAVFTLGLGAATSLIDWQAFLLLLTAAPVAMAINSGKRMPLNPDDLNIRWMYPKDIPYVLAIEKASFNFPWQEEHFLRAIRYQKGSGMIAKYYEKVIGYLVYELNKTRLHLLNFAVDPEYRGRGVGRRLMGKLKDELNHERQNHILLEVSESNLAAQLFFKNLGFRAVSVLHNFFDETNEDAYQMKYRLGSGVRKDGFSRADMLVATSLVGLGVLAAVFLIDRHVLFLLLTAAPVLGMAFSETVRKRLYDRNGLVRRAATVDMLDLPVKGQVSQILWQLDNAHKPDEQGEDLSHHDRENIRSAVLYALSQLLYFSEDREPHQWRVIELVRAQLDKWTPADEELINTIVTESPEYPLGTPRPLSLLQALMVGARWRFMSTPTIKTTGYVEIAIKNIMHLALYSEERSYARDRMDIDEYADAMRKSAKYLVLGLAIFMFAVVDWQALLLLLAAAPVAMAIGRSSKYPGDEKMRELIERHKGNHRKIAKEVKVSHVAVGKWLSAPGRESLKALAAEIRLPVGRHSTYPGDEKIQELLEKHQGNQNLMAQEANVTKSAMSKWLSAPGRENLKAKAIKMRSGASVLDFSEVVVTSLAVLLYPMIGISVLVVILALRFITFNSGDVSEINQMLSKTPLKLGVADKTAEVRIAADRSVTVKINGLKTKLEKNDDDHTDALVLELEKNGIKRVKLYVAEKAADSPVEVGLMRRDEEGKLDVVLAILPRSLWQMLENMLRNAVMTLRHA